MTDHDHQHHVIRSHLKKIVEPELEKTLSRLSDKSHATRQTLVLFAERIIDSVIEVPADTLANAEQTRRQVMIQTLFELFEVESQ